jgi:alpha-tubulin suppressor-like RCC1 family protein
MPRLTLKIALTAFLATLLFSPAAQASGGSAKGWGYNFFGQIGNGTPNTGPPCLCLPTPTAVAGLSSATQLSGSYYHSLGLLADGTVRSWGNNAYGQLGNGGTADSAAPVAVGGLSGVIAVAAGVHHSLALLANGTVMAWGRNGEGQLGLGTSSGPETCGGFACRKTPAPVPGLADVVAVAAGGNYSLALLANGTLVAWGSDTNGQLGDGTGLSGGCKCVDHPAPVPGVSGAMAISAGSLEASALLADGTVKNWGNNFNGGLGNGTTTTTGCQCLGPVTVSGLSGVRAVAAGQLFGTALLANGSVMAWGRNNYGQLGSGSAGGGSCECVPSAAAVSGLSGVREIATGANHGLALLGDGSVRSWGGNGEGQIGDGTTTQRNAPVPVAGVAGASEVAAGELSSFALIGPSQNLKVELAGAGAGTVGGPKGILCPPSCAGSFAQGQVEILRPEAAPGSAFAGFSGACTGTAPCQLRMDGDQAVAATFGPPKGTAITAATIDNKKKTASFSFTAPGAITGYECKLIRPAKKKKKPHHKKHKPKSHKAAHGSAAKTPPPSFSACAAPQLYKNLTPGRYSFEVRALDSLGADASPAIKQFTVKKPKPKHKKHKPKHHKTKH